MPDKQSALVIGSGLGGIATAARLARLGYRVTVLEKNASPGGRCGQFVRDGHRFDIGATLFLMPQVFAETYSALGESMEDHLDLRRIDPSYCIHFADGLELSLTGNLADIRAQLEAIQPGSFLGFLRFLQESHRHYTVSLQRFVGRNFNHLFDYFTPLNLPLMFQLKVFSTHYANIGNYFSDPHLKAAFTFQNMYLGLSPFDAMATYSLLQYTEMAEGVWFPIGGLYRVVDSLMSIARANGVEFIFNAPVEKIEVTENRAKAVILKDGTRLCSDLIIANADLPYVYRQLLPLEPYTRKLSRKSYTSSTIMFYWGIDTLVHQLDTHNVYLCGDYRDSFQQIFHHKTLPNQPSFYIHAPARVDPTAAPAGRDTLFVLVPVGHIDGTGTQDWDAMTSHARANVLNRLQQHGINDLGRHIDLEVVGTPLIWQERYNLEKGAAFGLSHNFTQVGYLRPHNRHRLFKNLYFVGSSTHPGTGLPMVLLSAKLTTERILQEIGVPKPISNKQAIYSQIKKNATL